MSIKFFSFILSFTNELIKDFSQYLFLAIIGISQVLYFFAFFFLGAKCLNMIVFPRNVLSTTLISMFFSVII